MFKKGLLFGLIAVLPLCVLAQERTIRIDGNDQIVAVQNQMEIFVDSSGSLSLKEIEEHYAAGNFIVSKNEVPNFTGVDGKIWFRLKILNRIDEPLYLSFPEIFLEEIALYTEDEQGAWTSSKTGYIYPFQSRALPCNRYTLKVQHARKFEHQVVFVSIIADAKPPLLISIQLGSGNAIMNANRQSEFISMAVLGILMIMLFYNFCVSIIIRDSLFLYYCAYIISSILLITWFTGFSFEWFWPESPGINPYPWALGPFYFTQLWFANRLLQTKENLPLLYKTSFVIYFFTFLMALSILMPAGFQRTLALMLSTLSPIYFLVCSISLVYRKIKIAYIFFIGWFPLLMVMICNMLMISDILPFHPAYDKHGVEITLAWELVVFSLVLGHRYNNLRHEKFVVQHENIRIITEQKATLRKMVFEQTEEIMSQNDQLIRNQDEIKLQNDRLETQNKAYERLKELILKQNHELETAVQRRTLQLAQSNEELKKHLHQVEQFSFISAHNLRAPVARILGLASIFDISKVHGKENLTILDKIVASAKDLDVIIHDLGAILDTQKNTSEKTETIEFKALLYKILNRYETEVGKEGIHVAINAVAKQIVAVPAYMDSILSNLISNSIKYRAEDRPPIIQITTEEFPSGWRIEVEDNGLGFDSKQFSRKLFEPFQRFHTHKDGKGLGMFLVKTQVIAMQGTIELESEPNKGTRVVITIPKRKFQKTA
jgi:signal transduction histidine kinase